MQWADGYYLCRFESYRSYLLTLFLIILHAHPLMETAPGRCTQSAIAKPLSMTASVLPILPCGLGTDVASASWHVAYIELNTLFYNYSQGEGASGDALKIHCSSEAVRPVFVQVVAACARHVGRAQLLTFRIKLSSLKGDLISSQLTTSRARSTGLQSGTHKDTQSSQGKRRQALRPHLPCPQRWARSMSVEPQNGNKSIGLTLEMV